MTRYGLILGLLLAFAALAGCATTQPVYHEAMGAFGAGRYRIAANKLETLKSDTNDLNYPIYLLDAAYTRALLGDDQAAEAYYLAGIKAMEQEPSGEITAVNAISPGEARFYRGDQYERVFAHLFLGRVYFRRGQYNDARIEFQKADELDISADNKTEHDVTLAHYLLGESYLRLDDANDAAVAFRNVARLRPEFPYSYYELARLARERGNDDEAERYYRDYLQRDRNQDKLPLKDDDVQTGALAVVVDLGDGPYRLGGATNQKEPADYPEKGASITVNGRDYLTYPLDAVLPHARHEAGKTVHAAKEAGLTAARRVLEYYAYKKTGVLILTDERDNRRLNTMPGEFQMVEIPLPPGVYQVQMNLQDSGRSPLRTQTIGGVRIQRGEKTYLFLRGWSGWHPPGGMSEPDRQY